METQNLEVDTLPEYRPWSPCRTRLLFLSSAFELCPPAVLGRPGDPRVQPALQAPGFPETHRALLSAPSGMFSKSSSNSTPYNSTASNTA